MVKEKGPAIKQLKRAQAHTGTWGGQVRTMGRREGQDNLSSMESLVRYCLMSPLALSTFPKDCGPQGMWNFQEMLRASDTSSMTLEVKAGPLSVDGS